MNERIICYHWLMAERKNTWDRWHELADSLSFAWSIESRPEVQDDLDVLFRVSIHRAREAADIL